ncbi:hypothetical protein A7976_10850 [Methylobacillus sp. MM3]|uniref:hypothetical protein n=1 Tax=Methylobacillus sp. MM3 TaxID=1848039 RepID=UPI0007E01D4E|nr:hypothetical protein [Methylobacillus sp. MM3]OAJ71937.1 hypothetical protein A7976_10850 [Methylobacillus sp. MM3]
MPLPLQVAISLLAFVAAACLLLTGKVAAIAGYHIVFAVGILPLILAAMAHFVPVLTRSGTPHRAVRFIPLAALAGGFLAVQYFVFPQMAPVGHYLGAIVAGSAAATFALWALHLRRKSIGTPHPCLDWYFAALACLLIGLCAILAGYWLPGQRAALRLLHLHMNTLGFIGITALGTLQVLLPTAAQKPDPDVGIRMRLHLKWVVAGTLLTAVTVAWQPKLAWIGLAVLALPLAAIFEAWLRLYRPRIFALHGAIPSLAAALFGYLMVLSLGAANGYFHSGFNLIAAFIVAFLMPLVTGAVSYLLPLWLRPGKQTEWHLAMRRNMGFASSARALILLAGGLMAGLGVEAGWALALFALGTFVAQIILALASAPQVAK